MSCRVGERIGGFRIVSAITSGSGSQGTVYRAVCEESPFAELSPGAEVAIKVMCVSGDERTRWDRLRRRTEGLSRLSHRNIVKYYGCFSVHDVFNELHVVVQEFLTGHTLKEELVRNPRGLDVDRALNIVDAAVEGLSHAFEHGLVHRDIKPGNIFLCSDGSVKVIDFEIARIDGSTMTSVSNNLRGSFAYMAPDFTDGAFSGDVSSDVFSMGVVLHEALTGRLPYARDTGRENADFGFLARWSSTGGSGESPIRISSRVNRLLAHASEVLEGALALDRSRRFRDFSALGAALRNVRFRDLRNGGSSYRFLQLVGRGGFGEVFKARRRETGELVAIKHLLKNAYAERFFREAKVMRRLSRGYFVQLVDFFVLGEGAAREAFLVMEFLDGMPGNSLRDAIRSSPGGLVRAEVLRAFARYAHGLSEMHRLGIYHRDIKPSNLYFPAGEPDRAAIMDLGIARDVNGTETHGQVPGTLDYMPPEVVNTSSRGDGGMDVFALGLCLYEALTGKMAYEKLPAGQQAYVQFLARATALRRPEIVPEELGRDARMVTLLREMTEPVLERRLRRADEVERRLLSLLEENPDSDRETTEMRVMPVPVRPMERTVPPVARRPAVQRTRSVSREKRPMPSAARPTSFSPFPLPWRWIALFAVVAAAGCLLAIARPYLCREVAGLQLEKVISAYDSEEGAESGAQQEAEWRSRWSPDSRSWFGLDRRSYLAFERDLEKTREALALKWTRFGERKTALRRLDGCLDMGGEFNVPGFDALNGWAPPEWLESDAEVKRRCAALSKVLRGALTVRTSVEPVSDRMRRISECRRLLANSWTPRLLSAAEVTRWNARIEREQVTVAGIVVNNASDVVRVDGHDLAANGGRRTVVVPDGHPEKISVSRLGFRSIRLPLDFNGREFAVSDASFSEAIAVRVRMPKFEPDVSCCVGDVSVASGAEVELLPGTHRGVYRKASAYDYRDPRTGRHLSGRKYSDQTFSIDVMPGRTPSVRPPSAWIESPDYVRDRQQSERWSRLPGRVAIPSLEPGVTCFLDDETDPEYSGKVRELKAGTHGYRYVRSGCQEQRGTFTVVAGENSRLPSPGKWVSAREGLREQVLQGCRRLLALEPVEDRQERLKQAEERLVGAIAMQRLFSQDEAAVVQLDREIAKLKGIIVGRVVNECTRDLTIGGHTIPAGTTKVLIYRNGLPDEWSAVLPGCERKELRRDLDGVTLRFCDDDFIGSNVTVVIPALQPDVAFVLDGRTRTERFFLKPGAYVGFYRRTGYQDQPVSFEVPPGAAAYAIPAPAEDRWRVR